MCIRDRSWAEASGVLAESHVRLSSGRRQQSHTWSGWQVPVLVDPEGALPVSYTHLDVYKRQVRQIAGSANIDGGPLMHLMTGNLSYQIEHHLFPDMPSTRYAEVALSLIHI